MMNNYFITKEDLEEMRDRMFTAIARAFWQLEHKVSLLINVGFTRRDSAEIRKGEKMSEKKIKALIEKLWILADKLDNKELLDIAKGLEAYVEKTGSNLKKFRGELKGLMERVKTLEEERK